MCWDSRYKIFYMLYLSMVLNSVGWQDMQQKDAVVTYFEALSRRLRDRQQLLQQSRARFEPSASRKPVRNLTQQVWGTHTLPLVHSVTEHNQHVAFSPRTCISLYSGSLSASVNKLSHPKARTPRGIMCRRLLGDSARAHLYPYSMDSASLTQCGRDVTTRRVFPSSPLRWTHLIPPEGRLGHVVCVCVRVGSLPAHCCDVVT